MDVKPGKVAHKAKKYAHILLVMRHAKAEPFGEEGDEARRLTEKGLRQAKAVAKGLKELKLTPDAIVCSTAERTRQTCEKMLRTFGDKPKVDYRAALYDGGVQSVFDELSHAKGRTRVLMVIGHEPTVSVASQWIASSSSDPALLDRLNLGLSPASLVVFGSDRAFSDWQVHDGELLAVLSPKDFD